MIRKFAEMRPMIFVLSLLNTPKNMKEVHTKLFRIPPPNEPFVKGRYWNFEEER